jgi:hypothetical protein
MLALLVIVGCNPLLATTKADIAAAKAEVLLAYAKTWSTRNQEQKLNSLEPLREYAEDGEQPLIDPWGQLYQFRYVLDPETGTERLVIWTKDPNSGNAIAAPRQLVHVVESGTE